MPFQEVRNSTRVAPTAADNGKSTAPAGAARTLKPKPATTNPGVYRALVWREYEAHLASGEPFDLGDFDLHVKDICAKEVVIYTLDERRKMLDAVEAREERRRAKSRQRAALPSGWTAEALASIPNAKLKEQYRH